MSLRAVPGEQCARRLSSESLLTHSSSKLISPKLHISSSTKTLPHSHFTMTLYYLPPSTTQSKTQSTSTPAMDALTYRETAGRAHQDLEQRKAKKEADRAKTLQSELRKTLGEDEYTTAPNSPRTTPQSGKKPSSTPILYQAAGSSSGQSAPYSEQEWARMQRVYDLGRERERKEGERRGADRTADGAQDMRGFDQAYGTSTQHMWGYGGARAHPNTRRTVREAYPNRQGSGGPNGCLMPRRGVRAVNTPWVFIDEEEARQAGYYYTVPL
jgi:hypothetical protein